MSSRLIAEARALLRDAGDFIEAESETRSAGGHPDSDYEREPRELTARIDAFLERLSAAESAA